MADLVVTVPREMWVAWIAEGDAAGEPESGEEWGFFLGRRRPPIQPGERLYVVAHDRVRGYAPVTRVAFVPEPCPHHAIEWAVAEALGSTPSTATTCERCRLETGHAGAQRTHGYVDYDVRPRLQSGELAPGRWAVCRQGGAQAVTIGPEYSRPRRPEHDDLAYVRGFQGFTARWWPREAEAPFPDWRDRDMWLNRAAGRKKRAVEQAKRKREAESRAAAATAKQGRLFYG